MSSGHMDHASQYVNGYSNGIVRDDALSSPDEISSEDPALLKFKRRVSFADDAKQQPLESFQYYAETDAPHSCNPHPYLDIRSEEEDLNCFVSKISASLDTTYDSRNEHHPSCSLQLKFPHSLSGQNTYLVVHGEDHKAPENVRLFKVAFGCSKTKFTGFVNVRNLAFEKRVFARYTFDGWQTCCDAPAYYIGKFDAALDSFAFAIPIRYQGNTDVRLVFCVFAEMQGSCHWDNNGGCNYDARIVWNP